MATCNAGFLTVSPAVSNPGIPSLRPSFMVLAPLYLKCLSGGDASTHTTASAAHVPLDIVAAIGDGVPVVVAFGITRDGKHLPAAANFDAFDDVDSRQNVSPASRILADSKEDSTWSK